MKKYLFFIQFFVTLIVYGQKSGREDFKLLVEPYAFNLPVQEVSLSMPAYMGFTTPKIKDEKTRIEINDEVNFFILSQNLQKENIFRFSKNDDEMNSMELNIIPVKNFFANTYLEQQKAKYPFFERIDPITNGLGKSTSYQCQVDNQIRDYYVFYLDNNLYSFSFATRSKDKTRYLNIVKKAKKLVSKEAITKYNSYLKSLYKSEASSTSEINTIDNGAFVVETETSQTISFTTEGLSYTLPANFTVVTSANDMERNGNVIEFNRDDDLLKSNRSEYYSTTLNNDKNLGFRYYSTLKSKNNGNQNYAVNLQSFKNGDIKTAYKIGKAQDILIDGIKAKVVFYGDDYYGFICINVESKNAYNAFFLGSVTKETLPVYDKIISGMKIESNDERILAVGNLKPLSSFVHLKEKPKYPIEYLSYYPITKDIPKNVEVTFEKIGLTVFLPGFSSEYKYNTSLCYCDYETLKLGDNNTVNIAPTIFNPSISIESENENYSVSLLLEKEFNTSYTVKDLLERDLLASYTKKRSSKFDKVFVWKSLDNVQWGVCIDYTNHEARVIGKNGEYSIYYAVKCKSGYKSDLDRLLYMFLKFRIKQI